MTSSKTKICPNCGKESGNEVNFCRFCGMRFEKRTEPESLSDNGDTEIKKEKSKAPLIAVLIAVIVLGVAFLIIYTGRGSQTAAPADLEFTTYRLNLGDGIISICEIAHKDDLVYSVTDTVEIKTASLTEDDTNAYLALFDELAFEAEGISGIKYIREIGDTKLTLGFEYSGLADAEVVKELMDRGYLNAGGEARQISLTRSESELLEKGYRKTQISE